MDILAKITDSYNRTFKFKLCQKNGKRVWELYSGEDDEFYIPIRTVNRFLSDDGQPELYVMVGKYQPFNEEEFERGIEILREKGEIS